MTFGCVSRARAVPCAHTGRYHHARPVCWGKPSSSSMWFISETTRIWADFKQTRNILMDWENRSRDLMWKTGYGSMDEMMGQKGKEKQYCVCGICACRHKRKILHNDICYGQNYWIHMKLVKCNSIQVRHKRIFKLIPVLCVHSEIP